VGTMLSVRLFSGVPFCLLLIFGGCAGHPTNGYSCHKSCDDGFYPKMKRMPHCPTGDRDHKWDNLVLQGGGVKGIAYGGALKVLNHRGHLEPIENVAGTSAGAITAALLAMGYNACEVAHYAKKYPYPELRDGKGLQEVPRLVHQYGVYTGDFFRCSMRCLAEDTLGDKDVNFKTLGEKVKHRKKNRHGRELKYLHVVATDVSTRAPVTFSHESEYADISIAEAVRKSMSIPFFFRAQVLEEKGPPPEEKVREHVFVDGGVVRNYPIGLFDGKVHPNERRECLRQNEGAPENCGINQRTLGLHLSEGRKPYYETNDIIGFTRQLFDTLTAVQIDQLCDASQDVKRTAFIDTYEISATDFDLTKSQKRCLVESGRQHMRAYLSRKEPDGNCPSFIQPTSDADVLVCAEEIVPPEYSEPSVN